MNNYYQYIPKAPYKGLESFSEQDRLNFFGRLKEQENIINHLLTWRLTLLFGPAGVGKSSLLQAGVVPYLRRIAQEHQKIHGKPGWAVTILTDWNNDPLTTIKKQLKSEIQKWFGIEVAPESNETFIKTLKFWIETIQSEEEGGRLYIILDQFDDYLLAKSQGKSTPHDAKESFDQVFAQAVNDPDLNVNFLVSIRDNFFSELSYLKNEIHNLYKNQIEIKHLNREFAKEAICYPVYEYNRQSILLGAINQSPLTILCGDRNSYKTTLLQDCIISQINFSNGYQYFNQWYELDKQGELNILEEIKVRIERKKTEKSNACLLLVLDQFEDYFRKRSTSDEYIFLDELLQIIKKYRFGNVKFLISVSKVLIESEEWLPIQENLPDHSFLELYKDGQNINRIRYEFKAKKIDEVQVDSKLTVKEIEIGSGLVEDILSSYNKLVQAKYAIEKKGVAAPYLQLVMFQLWSNRDRTGSNLTSDTLKELGGAEKIIRGYVNGILDELDEVEKRIAARIFYYLVTPSGASIAQDVQDLKAYLNHDFSNLMQSFPAWKERLTHDDTIREVLDKLSKNPSKRLFRPVSDSGYEVYLAVLSKAIIEWRQNYEEKLKIQERDLNQKLIPSIAQQAINLAKQLQSSQERMCGDYELAALLALQAYYLNRRNRSSILRQVDHALREVVKIPFQNQGKPTFTSEQSLSSNTDATDIQWLKHYPSNTLPENWMDSVTVVAVSADEQIIAVGCQDGSIYLWIFQDSPKKHRIRVPNSMNFPESPNNPRIEVFNPRRNQFPGNQDSNDGENIKQDECAVSAISISLNKQELAVGYRDGFMWVWDINRMDTSSKPLSGHTDAVYAIAFNPAGTLLASGSDDQTIRLWNLAQSDSKVLRGHHQAIRSVTFSADGKFLISVDADNQQYSWEVELSEPKILRGHRSEVRAVAYSPDGNWLASASWDNSVRLWNLKQPEITSISLPLAYYGESTIAFSPNSKLLVAGGYEQKDPDFDLPASVRIWDLSHPDAYPTVLYSSGGDVRAVAISSDGKWIAAGGWDRIVRLWHLEHLANKPISLTPCAGAIRCLAFSNNWKLAAGSAHAWDNKDLGNNTLYIWDVRQLKENNTNDLEEASPTILNADFGETFSVAFSPIKKSDQEQGEETLISVGKDNTLRIWDIKQSEVSQPTILGEYKFKGSSVTFGSDSQTIAAGSWTGATWLWNCNDFSTIPIEYLYQGEGSQYGQEITSVAISPDGQYLAAGSNNTTIQVWTINAQKLAEKIQDKLSRNLSKYEWDSYVGKHIPYEKTCDHFESGEKAPNDAPFAAGGLPDKELKPTDQLDSLPQTSNTFEQKLMQVKSERRKKKILSFIEDRANKHQDTSEKDVTTYLNKPQGDKKTYLILETLRLLGFLQIADNGNGPGTIRYRLSPEYQNYRQEHPTLK